MFDRTYILIIAIPIWRVIRAQLVFNTCGVYTPHPTFRIVYDTWRLKITLIIIYLFYIIEKIILGDRRSLHSLYNYFKSVGFIVHFKRFRKRKTRRKWCCVYVTTLKNVTDTNGRTYCVPLYRVYRCDDIIKAFICNTFSSGFRHTISPAQTPPAIRFDIIKRSSYRIKLGRQHIHYNLHYVYSIRTFSAAATGIM